MGFPRVRDENCGLLGFIGSVRGGVEHRVAGAIDACPHRRWLFHRGRILPRCPTDKARPRGDSFHQPCRLRHLISRQVSTFSTGDPQGIRLIRLPGGAREIRGLLGTVAAKVTGMGRPLSTTRSGRPQPPARESRRPRSHTAPGCRAARRQACRRRDVSRRNCIRSGRCPRTE